MDAVPYLFEDPEFKDEPLIGGCTDVTNKKCLDHIYTKNLPASYDMIYQFREVLDNFTDSNKVDTRYESEKNIQLYPLTEPSNIRIWFTDFCLSFFPYKIQTLRDKRIGILTRPCYNF